MKIGVVSDTHSQELPEQMLRDFAKMDIIIHAGDFCSLQDFKKLVKTKDVKGVYGNMDEYEVREFLPRKQILDYEGCKIGLFHGEGPPEGIVGKVLDEFKNEKVDIIIFGHSHQPLNQKKGNVHLFNPGSPNDELFAPYCSYGIIEIKNGKFTAKIIKVE